MRRARVPPAGCGGDGDSSASGEDWQIEGLGSTLEEIEAMASDEGEVNLVIWAGYADKSWADDFTAQTGCEVKTKDGAGSDDMVDQMATGAYDGVCASGDATLRLIAKGDVAPVNTDLTPNYEDVFDGLSDRSYNSVDGSRTVRTAVAELPRVPERHPAGGHEQLGADLGRVAGRQAVDLRRALHRRRGGVPQGNAARPRDHRSVQAHGGAVQRRRRSASSGPTSGSTGTARRTPPR